MTPFPIRTARPFLPLLTLVAGASLCGAPAAAQFATDGKRGGESLRARTGEELVEVQLVLEETSLVAGETNFLGLSFNVEPGWHIYWQNAGDTGAAPIIEFDLPEGVSRGEIRWPAPKRYAHNAGLLDYVYEGQVTLLVPIEIDAALAGRRVELAADIEWLVCRENCLPGNGRFSVQAPVVAAGDDVRPTAYAPLFAAARDQIPQPASRASALGVTTTWEGRTLRIFVPDADRLEFYPLTPDRGMLDAVGTGAANDETLRVAWRDRPLEQVDDVRGVLRIHDARSERIVELLVEPPQS